MFINSASECLFSNSSKMNQTFLNDWWGIYNVNWTNYESDYEQSEGTHTEHPVLHIPAGCGHGHTHTQSLCTSSAEASVCWPNKMLVHDVQWTTQGSDQPPQHSLICGESYNMNTVKHFTFIWKNTHMSIVQMSLNLRKLDMESRWMFFNVLMREIQVLSMTSVS